MNSESQLRPLPIGKLPIKVLDSTVLRLTGAPSVSLVTPPKAGLDFAAVQLDRGYLIVSADPITGVSADIGKYSMSVSANDVATSGNRPQFAEIVIMLPEGSKESDVARLAKSIDRTAKNLGISIVGGHTEVTPRLIRPIVVVTVFSIVKRFVTSGDAKEGDTIMMTKTAGLEGTAALAGELGSRLSGLPAVTVDSARGFVGRLSVVAEAVAAFRTGRVSSMHDCTEGGTLGAVYEMSMASGLGFELLESRIPVAPETKAICRELGLDPLRLIGSGSLLISVGSGYEDVVVRALRGICRVRSVGRFTNRGRVLVHRDGSRSPVRKAPEDELWKFMRRDTP